MPNYCFIVARALRCLGLAAAAIGLVLSARTAVHAQVFSATRAVGGIAIDTDGILQNATADDRAKLANLRAEALQEIPGDLGQWTELRKVSLASLEAALGKAAKEGQPLPDEIKYLAGLQQVRYVFVYPEKHDIVLAGPGEGWKVDGQGNVIGATTGRPVMLLDDLLVALRTARKAADGGISCSIDPTQEGLQQLQQHVRNLRTIGNPQQTAAGIEQALGPQKISVHGVPDESHFARVLVAADYRMKRLAMDFDPSPVEGLPSFLGMIKTNGRGLSNMLPRWWLEPKYEPLLRSPDGLAWELRIGSVKAMTEEDFLTASGGRQHTGKADAMAQKWANLMTEKYDQLALADPIFGQLRNCMELAVLGALVVKEQLPDKAGYSMPTLLDPADVKTETFCAPKQVNSQASLMKKGRNWVITASGGVRVNSWSIADKAQPSDAPGPIRAKSAAAENTRWWWN